MLTFKNNYQSYCCEKWAIALVASVKSRWHILNFVRVHRVVCVDLGGEPCAWQKVAFKNKTGGFL